MTPGPPAAAAGLADDLRRLGDALRGALREAFAARGSLEVRAKSTAHDLVSDADRRIEAEVRALLAAARPEDGFVGEESGGDDVRHGRRWVVDPIDGTMNFVHGLPWACSSVGLVEEGVATAGIVVAPFSDDLYLCAGTGSERNGEAVAVAPGGDLGGAMVLLEVPSGTSPSVLAPVADMVIAAGGSPRTMGSGALAMALAAAGVVQGVVHAGPSVWDVAAGVALVTQAGGVVRSASGPYVLGEPGPLVAGSAAAAERLAEALGRCPAVTNGRGRG